MVRRGPGFTLGGYKINESTVLSDFSIIEALGPSKFSSKEDLVTWHGDKPRSIISTEHQYLVVHVPGFMSPSAVVCAFISVVIYLIYVQRAVNQRISHFTGVIPPITQAEWEEEFEKYKLTPEFKL